MEFLTDAATLAHYGRDWTRFWEPRPSAVVFPRDLHDVVELVGEARARRQKLVPSGGRTGLSGGAVARDGEIVVAMEKMRNLVDFQAEERCLTVAAGATVGFVQQYAAEQGLYYPVDWAAAGSSQVGGSIATNAGGIRVLRYGMTRDWVRGLTVVAGNGEVLRLNQSLIKNNAGYDLRHLMIGSEGTLGLIVEATLGLAEAPPVQSVMLLGLIGWNALMPVLACLRSGLRLSAFEMFDRRSVALVAEASGRSFPLDSPCPCYALVEFDDPEHSAQAEALARFEQLLEDQWVTDGTLSQSGQQAEELWLWRESISESIAVRTPYKNDLVVRPSRVSEFLADLERLVRNRYPDFEVVWFGHIGDGNLHMNVLRPRDWMIDDFHRACQSLTPAVFELVQRHHGSISAEHGVGLLKRDGLGYSRTAPAIALMGCIKQALDPDGISNPGKPLPPLK